MKIYNILQLHFKFVYLSPLYRRDERSLVHLHSEHSFIHSHTRIRTLKLYVWMPSISKGNIHSLSHNWFHFHQCICIWMEKHMRKKRMEWNEMDYFMIWLQFIWSANEWEHNFTNNSYVDLNASAKANSMCMCVYNVTSVSLNVITIIFTLTQSCSIRKIHIEITETYVLFESRKN